MNTLERASIFLGDIKRVMDVMISIDKEVGDIWKWPDTRSSFLYALTEAAEFLEAHLLKNRPGDSRNNKTINDFDSATELFDVSMMLIRGLLKSYRYVTLQEAVDIAMNLLLKYVEKHINQFEVEDDLRTMFVQEPERVAHSVCHILQDKYIYNNPEPIFDILIKIHNSNVYTGSSYADIASQKLTAIRNKNLAKKAAKNAAEAENNGQKT